MASNAHGIAWCTELMQTILPVARDTSGCGPRRRNSLTASREHRNMPVRLTSITRCHCLSVMSWKAAPAWIPALFTRTCTVP